MPRFNIFTFVFLTRLHSSTHKLKFLKTCPYSSQNNRFLGWGDMNAKTSSHRHWLKWNYTCDHTLDILNLAATTTKSEKNRKRWDEILSNGVWLPSRSMKWQTSTGIKTAKPSTELAMPTVKIVVYNAEERIIHSAKQPKDGRTKYWEQKPVHPKDTSHLHVSQL